MKTNLVLLVAITIFLFSCEKENTATQNNISSEPKNEVSEYKIASFNCSFNRKSEGALLSDLSKSDNLQAQHIAEIIQRVRPDVLTLMEFDFYAENKALELFQKNYLSISQNGVSPIDYPYYWAVPANTGMPSGTDLNNNGKTDDAADCFGFGTYKGQYAFAIFSKFPIKKEQVRSFQKFLWKDMPNANFPIIPSTKKPYYSQEAMNVIRLSSKNHIDVPIAFPNKKEIHLLVSHPTPPVFDGDEDRNGMRNHDEIRLFADYITSGKEASYIYDDKGEKGGIAANTHFVIMGDLNADPIDGGSYQSAIKQLLNNEKVNQEVAWGKFIPMSKGSTENSQKERFKNHKGNPNTDTSAWGLRVDYALPSANLKVKNTGVFWVDSKDSLNYLINDTKTSSDHRLVWLTIED